jgi:magnesium-transporting ATPase (P-type)
MFLLKSDSESGIIFVDTMQLDGETNLKDKTAPVETSVINETMIYRIRGDMSCDAPNANLEHWEAGISFPLPGN